MSEEPPEFFTQSELREAARLGKEAAEAIDRAVEEAESMGEQFRPDAEMIDTGWEDQAWAAVRAYHEAFEKASQMLVSDQIKSLWEHLTK